MTAPLAVAWRPTRDTVEAIIPYRRLEPYFRLGSDAPNTLVFQRGVDAAVTVVTAEVGTVEEGQYELAQLAASYHVAATFDTGFASGFTSSERYDETETRITGFWARYAELLDLLRRSTQGGSTRASALAAGYTRGRGFDDAGQTMNPDLHAVTESANDRMTVGTFHGWTPPELVILNRYRRRTA